MPTAAPHPCRRCGRLVARGATCQCRKPFEGSTHPANTRRWRKTRAAKLRASPLCEHPGCRRIATTVDHIQPLAEAGSRWSFDNLQSLCREHDIAKTAADAQRGKVRRRGNGG